MKEAIGTSFVFNLIMVFIGVLIALVIGSISYSKAAKIKNRIIDIIERNAIYETAEVTEEVENDLRSIGYRVTNNGCSHKKDENLNDGNYDYCVYKYSTSKGPYYKVRVYMHFDVPLIGSYIKIPIEGESKVLFDESIEG